MMWWALLVIILLFCAMALTGAPYVPSHRRDVQQALTKLYRLGAEDCLVDMGSGDGVVLKVARQQGARAFGVELNPLLVLLSRWRLRGDTKAMVVCGNLYRTNFPPSTTVVYTFGDSRDIARMAAHVQQQATRLGTDLWFISYAFAVPGWTPVREQGAHKLYRVWAEQHK